MNAQAHQVWHDLQKKYDISNYMSVKIEEYIFGIRDLCIGN